MIEAKDFVEAARELGFVRYTGVPCSFLTPFINYVINDSSLEYISSSNEGDALATTSGSVIGGQRSIIMMQNSGLGNAVSPITSLSYVFKIPFLIIVTHRGQPGIKDEPQHELMGQITKDLFDIMKIPSETFPNEKNTIIPALERAEEYMSKKQRPYAFIMSKGTVAPEKLNSQMLNDIVKHKNEIHYFFNGKEISLERNTVLRRIIKNSPKDKTILIATTGYTGRELFSIEDRDNHIYMVGSMGCASSFALGLALAKPDLKIIIIDGDGAGLMRMGNFSTIGTYASNNLIHILLDNEVHDSTGAQSTVSRNIDFSLIAKACGYSKIFSGNKIELIDELFSVKNNEGPIFGHLKICSGTIKNLPRPNIKPEQVLRRMMRHINTSF
ncbi:MAG: phosphonopyruvate decarboxylase [Pseudomonadota bacterium]|nr:phosphonopyruvate decarboxylase [Pseudomonadota bacterium]